MANKKKRYVECIALFFILPGLLYFVRHHLAFQFYYLLAALALICAIILYKDSHFDRTNLWRRVTRTQLRSIVVFFLPASAAMALLTYFFVPSKFLVFPTTRPFLWLIIMVFYPLGLVLPQELLFRCFFFHRYRILFETRSNLMVFMNALSFGLFHVFYGNWVAPVLTFLGGLLFAWRYRTSRSLLAVSLEHAIWGNYLFTTGMGWYFYSGSIT